MAKATNKDFFSFLGRSLTGGLKSGESLADSATKTVGRAAAAAAETLQSAESSTTPGDGESIDTEGSEL